MANKLKRAREYLLTEVRQQVRCLGHSEKRTLQTLRKLNNPSQAVLRVCTL
jgi:hypothetical protein